jgi:hypothetical protein
MVLASRPVCSVDCRVEGAIPEISMGITYAIDELYATGWQALDTAGCEHHADGRPFPTVDSVCQAFAAAGLDLSISYISLFDCHRAQWRDATGAALGAVVGTTASEAAVYALAQLRRSPAAAHA